LDLKKANISFQIQSSIFNYELRLTFLSVTRQLFTATKNMNQNLTEIACVIDRSGSMEAIASDAIGGFNSFLNEQKKHPDGARLTLVLFDHEYEVICESQPLEYVSPLNSETYVPRGTTALLDAIGRTIDDLGIRLAKISDELRPGKVIIAILTDGLENASKDYSKEKISQMIEHQRTKYSWEFIFLAANQDAIATAESIAIQAQDAMNFAASPAGTRVAFASLSADVSRRRSQK
jgi:hypothetical protein